MIWQVFFWLPSSSHAKNLSSTVAYVSCIPSQNSANENPASAAGWSNPMSRWATFRLCDENERVWIFFGRQWQVWCEVHSLLAERFILRVFETVSSPPPRIYSKRSLFGWRERLLILSRCRGAPTRTWWYGTSFHNPFFIRSKQKQNPLISKSTALYTALAWPSEVGSEWDGISHHEFATWTICSVVAAGANYLYN